MANPSPRYGFWWADDQGAQPTPEEYQVATAKDFNINGSSVDMNLNIGDQVTLLSTGYLDIAEGSEASGGTADTVLGIVVGVRWYWDVARQRMVPASKLPSGIAWGTIFHRASVVQVIPATLGQWYVQCDDAVTATTEAAYMALRGECCDAVLSAADTTGLNLRTLLDISTHAATGQWQLVSFPKSPWNSDFSATRVTARVRCFEPIAGVGGVAV